MKVLLVDDSRTIRNIEKKTFAQLGYSDVMEAADGVEALKRIGETRPDLVLIDWNMPHMDGITLVRKSRRLYAMRQKRSILTFWCCGDRRLPEGPTGPGPGGSLRDHAQEPQTT